MAKQKFQEIIEIPENIKVELVGRTVKMSRDGEEIKKDLNCDLREEKGKLILESERGDKMEKKMIKTARAHIRNMISGLEKSYVYKLQICSVHFPMSVNVSGNELVIKNFLGETVKRTAKILPGVNVSIQGDIISVENIDKEKAGQTAANIEKSTRIKKRDRRVFQDGIFIIKKEKGARREEK